ncbi:hypothetical protein [Burkholderia gladioli]|uniref:hypothetical protein n=1 Tax=Burkholderia gladioli TaxID=28095 RepID=UPI001ABA4943|nr:hypothetical protein [Burkholderia gladioli]MDC6131730.1 hypothetical protein [Burkholderia gladioli]
MAIMTFGTELPRDSATKGAIGPKTSEFEPITATLAVNTYTEAGRLRFRMPASNESLCCMMNCERPPMRNIVLYFS